MMAKALPQTTPEESLDLITHTDREWLLAKIEADKKAHEETIRKAEEENIDSELNKGRRAKLVWAIMSVYYFLRTQLGMPPRELSLKEFKIAEQMLKDMANEAQKSWRIFSPARNWKFFLREGHFDTKIYTRPFGEAWSLYLPKFDNNKESEIMQPLTLLCYLGSDGMYYSKHFSFTVPSNLKELVNELFEEQFRQKTEVES